MDKLNRRQFIGTAVAGTIAMTGPLNAATEDSSSKPKLKLGLIGCGWYGMVDVKAAFKVGGVEVIALCDVDSEHLSKSADEVEKLQSSRPKTFRDYHELLEVPGLQAVIIATPPHWHALMFIDALEKGLDIYCEKPLAYDVREGQAMVAAAKRHSNCIVQIGFQRRQSKAIQQAKQFIDEGGIGKVIQAEAQIHYKAGMRDATPQDPPASLDWDQWCGPSPKLPYSPQIGHMSWRLEKQTGHGHLVDWGIHLIDATRWILGQTMPQAVQASGGIYYFKNQITTPDILNVHFDFERCPVIWRHHIWGAAEYTPEVANGIFFYGEKGTVFVTDNKWIFVPKKGERQVHEIGADMGAMHMADFLDAVKKRKGNLCTPEDAHRSTATVKLAMISYDVGAKIEWDEEAHQIVDNAEAAALLKRDYRSPWKHPYSE